MPQEVIDRPNPGPLPSELPDDVSQLAIRLEGVKLDEKEFQAVQKFRRLATYIAGGMTDSRSSSMLVIGKGANINQR